MSPRQARLVTACQQLLALGVVLAVLTPATGVISLDVVGRAPGVTPGPAPRPVTAGPLPTAAPPTTTVPTAVPTAVVPTAPVEPVVREVSLTTDAGQARPLVARRAGRAVQETPEDLPTAPAGSERVVSAAQPVERFGTVGVTWSAADEVDEEGIVLEVRTRSDDTWTDWVPLEYHDDHSPDPGSPDAASSRPGTDPTVVGRVDAVQVAATASGALPRDLALALVEPGEAEATATEAPAITVGPQGAVTAEQSAASAEDGAQDGPQEGAIALQASIDAARPTIYSRAQWGADERLRDRGSLRYGSISAGFVHHTVNGNDYDKADVPGILRSIYAYHTRSRGWSDIGYNFLVDKFGRIWEGRYGGVSRPVVGAHTLGYNDYSFAMSAIGNFDVEEPTDAMLRAYGALFAWKLGLHGVRASDMSQRVGSSTFPAINGHRDAGSTACPGRYLYARLGTIRKHAQAAQDAGTTPAPEPEPEPEPEPAPVVPTVTPTRIDSDLAGTAYPDLVVRRASDQRGMVVPTGGLTRFTRPSVVAERGWGGRTLTTSPDLTGDGVVDLLVVDARGGLEVRPGLGGGDFGAPTRVLEAFRRHTLPTAAGDLDGDGRNDVVARGGGRLVAFLQTRRGGFRRVEQAVGLRGYTQLVGAGDVTRDGRVDLWGRTADGTLYLHRGSGDGAFGARQRVAGDFTGYAWVAAGADHTFDGIPDLVGYRPDGRLMVLPSRGDGTVARAVGPVRSLAGLRTMSGAGQLVGGPTPDLLVTTDAGKLLVLGSRGTFDIGAPIDTGRSFRPGNLLINAGDFDGNGHGDVLMRRHRGQLLLFRGNGTGRLGEGIRIGGRGFGRVTDLRVTGDVSGDGRPDVIGTRPDGSSTVWPGAGTRTLGEGFTVELAEQAPTPSDSTAYDWKITVSDLRRRGGADVIVREPGSGHVYRLNGNRRGLGAPRYLGEVRGYDLGG